MSAISPYTDIELCFPAVESHLSLVRSVAAGVACLDGEDCEYAEDVRLVVDEVVSTLLMVAADGATTTCLFRLMESEIRLSVSVASPDEHVPEREPVRSRLLDQLVESASTIAVPDGQGHYTICSDVVIPRRTS